MKKLITSVLTALFAVLFTCSPLTADDAWRTIQPDVVYGHKAGMALTFDVITPAENANGAAVLFMMSGGWVSAWTPPENLVREAPRGKNLFENIVSRGYTLILVRHGSSPHFKVPDAVSDVQRAIQFISDHAEDWGIDRDRIGVCGGSAGGHLSLVLGAMSTDERILPVEERADDADEAETREAPKQVTARVAAVAAYFPPTDIRTYVNSETLSNSFPALVFPEELGDDVSPLLFVTKDDAPTILIHGDQDKLVPIWHSEKIKKAFDREGVECELVVIEGAAHGFQGEDDQRAQKALLDWFDKHLAKSE